MAWIEPVTDRTGGEYMTDQDCNRITGNILYLDASATLPADVTQNDVLTTWLTTVTAALKVLCLNLGVKYSNVTSSWTCSNINQIEALTKECFDRVELLKKQNVLAVYSGELYSAQGDYYVGGF